MRHTPYGYRIVNGMAVINEEQAVQIREFFKGYLSGLALSSAAKTAGLNIHHGPAGRILRNKHYLGDEYYPAIIDKETFEAAAAEREKRAIQLGRVWDQKEEQKGVPLTKFEMGNIKNKFSDPFKQAEYVYSLIKEGEVDYAVG